jgi:uncharacterized protein YjbJ (UPF0337 family)
VSTSGTGTLKGEKEGTMNSEQFKGKWSQFKGELKKRWGKFTDDDLLQIEGDYDKFTGTVMERYGTKKEEVNQWAEEWYRDTEAARSR